MDWGHVRNLPARWRSLGVDVLARGNEALERLEQWDEFRKRYRRDYAMKTYMFEDRTPKLDGPWAGEPDKAQWIDTVTDLDCLTVRNWRGVWCGYVGVQPGHKWHGEHYGELGEYPNVHGGLTYSDFCMEGAEDGPGVCHVPGPGRPANVWWLGFDCGHGSDLAPRDKEFMPEDVFHGLFAGAVYRDFEYVRQQCAQLALQIRDA